REPGAAPVPDPLVLETVPPTPTLAPAERVHVYAGMYFWRLVDALREDFPKLATVLGDGGFADLVRGYIRAHPSTAPSIRHLGRALPDFLAGYPPASLAALARLAWTRRSSAWPPASPSRPSARDSTLRPRPPRSSCAGSRTESSPGPGLAAEIRRPCLARKARWWAPASTSSAAWPGATARPSRRST